MSHNSRIEFDSSLEDVRDDSGLFVILVLFTTLIILSTTSRIATKFWHRSTYGLSDVFILIALAFNLTGNVLEFLSIDQGFGRHLQFLTLKQELILRKWNQYTLLFAFISIWAVKLSVAFFILSLIRGTHKRSQWVCYGLIALTTVATLIQAVFWGLQAQPIQKLWEPEIPGTLAPRQLIITSITAFSSINLVTDFFFALSPIYFFGGLQMDIKKKVIIFSLTGSGLLVVIAASFRLVFLKDFTEPDFTWRLPKVYTATIIERNFAEFIADTPVLFSTLRIAFMKTGRFMQSFRSAHRADGETTDRSNGVKNSKSGQTTLVTIGSAGRRKAKNGQFHELGSAVSEDQIYLRDISRGPEEVEIGSEGR